MNKIEAENNLAVAYAVLREKEFPLDGAKDQREIDRAAQAVIDAREALDNFKAEEK